jgi:hypothetical protein
MPQPVPFTREALLLSAAALAALAAGAWFVFSRRHQANPEVRRRALIDARGRIIEGSVIDFRDGVVYYTWQWRGVDYEASQDLSEFSGRLPAAAIPVGPVSVKFLPAMPSNSIVMSETWSGFSVSGNDGTFSRRTG